MQRDPLRPGDDDDLHSDSLNDSAAEEPRPEGRGQLSPRLAEFERLYRAEFGAVAGYFARRCQDPQLVADLTADTFVAAIRSFAEYDPRRTGTRAWTIGIARRVYARFRESDPREQGPGRRSSARRLLDRAETKELTWWIDVERSSRELMERLAPMSALDREALELVDLCGLSHGEAARELGVSTGALRVRLSRTRARLKREGGGRG
jgi:RNA polymerase sigma-70 factor (ECF subfamily)